MNCIRRFSLFGAGTPASRCTLPTLLLLFILAALLLGACTALPVTPGTEPAALPPAESPAESTAASPDATAAIATPAEGEASGKIAYATPASPSAQWAFVRDQVLYIHIDGNEIEIEDCSENRCSIYYPSWSPGGRYLLYYVGFAGESPANVIRVAELNGRIQTLTDQAAYVRPPGWSPAGDRVVYFRSTGRYQEDENLLGLEEIFEIWVAEIEESEQFGEAEPPSELLGEVGFGQGCGGGGRSESANAYEREGGFAYGYLAGVMAWTADDILLYSNDCTSRGIGRFDLTQKTPLEPYAEALGSLSMSPARDQWVAVDDQGYLVQGSPASLDTVTLNNAQSAELVYWGAASDSYYYTTLETTYTTDMVDEVGQLGEEVWVSPYFDRGRASIRRFVPASGTDELVWSADDYAYARLYENNQGVLLFSSVEPGDRLLTAIQEQQLTAANWREFLPTVHVQMLQVGNTQPIQVFQSAHNYSLWQ